MARILRCYGSGVLLWLWRRLVATALIRPLAREPPYAVGVAQEMPKRQKKKKKKKKININQSRGKGEDRCRLWFWVHFAALLTQRETWRTNKDIPIYLSVMQISYYMYLYI